mmetsp:Transcript_118364/g.339733  ORF Transcript_118364/g.339733 Transcript_118364/m.339733 type:complete len:200 (+) Transcript_118364:329-928(+)
MPAATLGWGHGRRGGRRLHDEFRCRGLPPDADRHRRASTTVDLRELEVQIIRLSLCAVEALRRVLLHREATGVVQLLIHVDNRGRACDISDIRQLETTASHVEMHPRWRPRDGRRKGAGERRELFRLQAPLIVIEGLRGICRREVTIQLQHPIRPTLEHAVGEIEEPAEVFQLPRAAADGAELRHEAADAPVFPEKPIV